MLFDIFKVADKEFTYIICGGGTAGLTLAARLSEDPEVTVAVLEAGQPNLDDEMITVPGQFGQTFGNPQYDWNFKTSPQRNSLGKTYSWNRGKGLGGSSAMNFYAWIKPPAGDVNAIEALGNEGWNWEEYAKYSRLSETFHAPTPEQIETYPHTYEPENRGQSGPIQTTVPHSIHTIDNLFQSTMVASGVKAITDPYGGSTTGTWMAAANLDPVTWSRSYSASAHYTPNKNRPNLTVLTEATVCRVLFADAEDGEDLVATGVEFIHGGKTYTTRASREVILSAGTIKSPQILELSGIGRPEVLKDIGVDVNVSLAGVGENMQEHILVGASYELKQEGGQILDTYDRMRQPSYAAEARKQYAELKGPQRVGITSFAYIPLSIATENSAALIDKVEREVEESKAAGTLPPGLAEQLDLQVATLRDPELPDFELIAFPGFFGGVSTPERGHSYVTILSVLNHPFSRGTIHCSSGDALANPTINPSYFENDFDLQMLVEHFKFIRGLNEVEPWKSSIVRELDPGPECQTDEEIRTYIKEMCGTCWHTIGTCSMLPRDKQGVVSPELKVYGTKNLRVVDISILPLHLATHTHATAYVIAEKAADLISGHIRV